MERTSNANANARPIIEFENISKRFGGVQALDAVTFGIERGDAMRDAGGRFMVVGYDHVDSVPDDFFDFFGSRDAAVDSNDNNESGDSSASFVYTTTPSEDPPPSAPRNLRVINRGEGFVDLAWDAPLFHTGALTYNVYFFTAGNITKSTAQKGIEGLADTSTRAANLDKEKTHYFVVTAVDNNGESAESGEVSAIPDL